MTSRIRALNEEESSSESEDEANKKLSKEAQEQQLKQKYHEALKKVAEGKRFETVEILEDLLKELSIEIYDDAAKAVSPFAKNLRLGCLRMLGDLYMKGECKNLVLAKKMYEEVLAREDGSKEFISIWYALGKTLMEIGEPFGAVYALSYILHARQFHWGAIDKLITACYAISDYKSCLEYCALGLNKDPGYTKGLVFRDLVYQSIPELMGMEMRHAGALDSKFDYDDSDKERFIEELRILQEREREKIGHMKIADEPIKIVLKISSLSLIKVAAAIHDARVDDRFALAVCQKVKISWVIEDTTAESEELSKPGTTEESQTGDESQCAAARSRSSSDDKENIVLPSDGTSSLQEASEKKGDELISENSQPQDSQQNSEGDGSCKKKGKGNFKWWMQMAGKRRSQRVRGHLMPTSSDKAKNESSFSDQLKNLIPTPLLGDENIITEPELPKSPDKRRWQKTPNVVYLGTKEEEKDAKDLLGSISNANLAEAVAIIVAFLANNVKCPWHPELRELYYNLYRMYRTQVDINTLAAAADPSRKFREAFIIIAYVEIMVDKFIADPYLRLGLHSQQDMADIDFVFECIENHPNEIPREISLRMKWALLRRGLDHNKNSEDDFGTKCLQEMEEELRQNPATVWTVNATSNLICLETVLEKAACLTKTQNSQTITDLYQSKDYESLIDVLESCINFTEVEKRDLPDIYFYSVALFKTDKTECISHIINLLRLAVKYQENNILAKTLELLSNIWNEMKSRFTLRDKKAVVGHLIKTLVTCELKPPPQEVILCLPWCILHSITFSLEEDDPVLYLEEDAPPNSILLLQMGHECMSRTEKCCVDNGRLMLYTMKAILQVKKMEEYFAYEETRNCMEQAIYCLYSHPNKKSKAKNLKDHNSNGINLTWELCPTLYQYYIPDTMPEFDSYRGERTIGAEVEGLFQRLLDIMPEEQKPKDRQKKIKDSIEACEALKDTDVSSMSVDKASFPKLFRDIYYLIGDYNFKSKEWQKAVQYYTWDLAVVPTRFDSWAGIALSLGETVNITLSTSDTIEFKELLKEAQSTAYCFNNALKNDPNNIKLRIEFGSFVYAMHAYCSRQIKHNSATVDMELFKRIEEAKADFLKSSFRCFEPIVKDGEVKDLDESEETAEEGWLHHYMLGKINEKLLLGDRPEEFLSQYEIAGKLLHEEGAPYPSKMNYYSPPELAIEALEIYYRIHASILTLVEHAEYSKKAEKQFLEFIRRQNDSPFVKKKQSRGDGGEGKKGKRAVEDAKKDMIEVTALMNDILDQTEKLVAAQAQAASSGSSTLSSSSSSSDDSSSDTVKSLSEKDPAPISSFSLSEFKRRLQEKELREEKKAIATEAKKLEVQKEPEEIPPPLPEKEVDIYEGLELDKNHFYEEFKDVKFGAVIALCLKAMEECILRYPSHYKSYYRLANSYIIFLKDAKKAREYLMGSPALSQRKIIGLLGERKTNNFFNGIWKNPVDDVDRAGSFAYHMNKAVQLLLDVLSRLNDHQLLVEIVLQLSKVPDNEKKYLSNPDREMFCQQALSSCVTSVKRKISEKGVNYHDLGIEVVETYLKLQKQNPRQNPLAPLIHDIYLAHMRSLCPIDEANAPSMDQSIRYFTFQQMSLKASRGNSKNSGADQKGNGQEGPPRKRGRRARVASQEAMESTPPQQSAVQQSLDVFNMMSAAFQQGSNFIDNGSPLQSAYLAQFIPSVTSLYPKLQMQGGVEPNMFYIPQSTPTSMGKEVNSKTPPAAHDFSRKKGPGPSKPTQSKSLSQGDRPVPNSNSGKIIVMPSLMSRKVKDIPLPKLTSLVKPGQSKPDRSPSGSGNGNRCPPPPPLHPIRLNTSPFKAQSTVVEQPKFQFCKDKNAPAQSQSGESRKSPPAAHSNATPPKKVQRVGSTEGSEVIDLTVKTPEKEKNSRPPQIDSAPKPSSLPTEPERGIAAPIARNPTPPIQVQPSQVRIPQRTSPYPLPPKKKHQLMHQLQPRSPNPPPPQKPPEDQGVEVIEID